MKKLVRVVRHAYNPEFVPEGNREWRRRLPLAIIQQRQLDSERSNFTKEGEFFLIEEEDVNTAMQTFAEANPGCEVQIYGLEASAQCPAAPMVVKTVTKDGVLPG